MNSPVPPSAQSAAMRRTLFEGCDENCGICGAMVWVGDAETVLGIDDTADGSSVSAEVMELEP